MWKIWRWFTYSWYKYLFGHPLGDEPIERILCRIKGHTCGVIWYDPTGVEPDMRCKHCYEDLG